MNSSGRGDTIFSVLPILSGIAVLFIVFILNGSYAGSSFAKEQISLPISTVLSENQIYDEMRKYLGIPYRRGGSTRKGTDCSGLIRQIYGDLFCLDMPHNAAAQNRLPFIKDVSRDDLRVGDLVFFGPDKRQIRHIGAYLSNGKFIHASSKAGVIVSSLSNSYWRKRLVRFGRIQGLEFSPPERRFNPEERTAQRGTICWDISALESESGAGLVSDLSLKSFLDVNVKTFTLFLNQRPAVPTLSSTHTAGMDPERMGQSIVRQGIRLSTEWAMFDWLQVAPFWTCVFEHDQESDDFVAELRHMGVSAEIAHPNQRWSISFAAQPPFLQYDNPSLWNTDWREMDLFFGWHYHISNTWKLSFLGYGHAGITEAEAETSSITPSLGVWRPEIEDMAIRLDFRF